ncbi:GntR family transcriptional regulator [Virgibacillus phasianinus]|uniref:GntR family transcriptional regulator n=1 Tax=Virgibacillus phasianinus TaxID=2017483 RepID=A0A220TYU4_9BACI|nr:FadR/GntR family transcriptional regulator [Virgibacillus phasianinus]ASK60982.1 GntR family transcriptional regulator [Virgibacillus phasianinus]
MDPIKETERTSLKKTVIEEIKKYMIDHHLKAGDKLPTERKFVEMFGVSRSVIREALSYLENTGVIRVRQGQGAFLNESNIDNLLNNFFFLWQINGGKIQDILSLRIIFESSAIDEIVNNHSRVELQRLKEVVEESKEATTLEEFREADSKFHKQILQATNNYLFIQMTNMITSYFFEVKHIHLTIDEYQTLIAEHEEIVEALLNKKADQAKELLTRHMKKTKI